MPKMATKAADNVFYKARMEAAKWNDKLSSREGAAEVTGLEKEYGITSPAELMEAMRNMPKLDISIFVTTPSGKGCLS